MEWSHSDLLSLAILYSLMHAVQLHAIANAWQEWTQPIYLRLASSRVIMWDAAQSM